MPPPSFQPPPLKVPSVDLLQLTKGSMWLLLMPLFYFLCPKLFFMADRELPRVVSLIAGHFTISRRLSISLRNNSGHRSKQWNEKKTHFIPLVIFFPLHLVVTLPRCAKRGYSTAVSKDFLSVWKQQLIFFSFQGIEVNCTLHFFFSPLLSWFFENITLGKARYFSLHCYLLWLLLFMEAAKIKHGHDHSTGLGNDE